MALNPSDLSSVQISCLFCALSVARFILANINIFTDIKFRKKLLKYILKIFNDGVKCDQSNESNWQSFVTLDTVILAERISAITDIIFYILCLCSIILTHLFLKINILYGFIGIIPYICISCYIAKRTIFITKKLYNVTKNRIRKISLWLSNRKYFINWQNDFGLLNKIEGLLQKEITLRNKDSLLKCINFYAVIFSRAFLVIFFISLNLIFGKQKNDYVLIYWFSMPIINLIMELGRYTYDYNLAKKSAENIILALSHDNNGKKNNQNRVCLDSTWDIWDGSLYDNIIFSDELTPYIKILRLDEEFYPVKLENLELTRTGSQISLGQKERILLLRAVSIALQTQKTLQIKINFHSVDPKICVAILSLFNSLREKISVKIATQTVKHLSRMSTMKKGQSSNNNHSSLNNVKNYAYDVEEEPPEPGKKANIFYYFFKLNTKASFLFFIPALLLSLVTNFFSDHYYANWVKLPAIAILSSISIFFASKLGCFIESNIRNSGKRLSVNMICEASLLYIDDIVHRIGRDLTMLFERLSWYVHDLCWYTAVLLTGAVCVTAFAGLHGLTISLTFIGLCFGILVISVPKINIAQKNSIYGINQFLRGVLNYNALGSASFNTFLRKKFIFFLTNGISIFEYTNASLVRLKAYFSNTIQLLSGLFISVVIYLLCYKDAWFLPHVLLTSLLMIDHIIVNFFQAASGFYVTHISYTRLTDYPRAKCYSPLLVSKKENIIHVPPAVNPCTNVYYRERQFEIKNIYRLVEDSGKGKSNYLKVIAGIMDDPSKNNSYKVTEQVPLYFDNTSIKLLQILGIRCSNISELIEIFRPALLIIADEVFRTTKYELLEQRYSNIKLTVREKAIVGLIVDHRWILGNKINL